MKKSKITIIPFELKNDLNEIYQSSKITFAFLSAPKDGNKQCHQFVKCRDFLQDVIRATLTGNESKIYGFLFNKNKNPPIDLKRTRLLVKNNGMKEEKADEVMLKAEKLLHHYENMLNIPFTAVKKQGNLYIFNGSNFWQFSPTMISLYTLFIRLAEYNFDFELYNDVTLNEAYTKLVNSDSNTNEIIYLRSIKPFINIILRNVHYIFIKTSKYDCIYFKEVSMNKFHNGSGIVSLCTAKDEGAIYYEAYQRLQKVLTEDAENITKLPIVAMPEHSGLYSFSTYNKTQIKFGIVEQEENLNKLVTPLDTCREQLTYYFKSILKENSNPTTYSVVMTLTGLANNTLAMVDIKPKVFFAKRIINFIEAKYGMKKTAISTICLARENSKFKHFGWLFSCSNEWLDSPIMLSLFILIIRTVIKYSVLSEKIYKKITDDIIIEISNYKKENFNKNINNDFNTLHDYIKPIDIILKNRKVLFFNNTTKQDNYYVSLDKVKELNKNCIYKTISTALGIQSLITKTHIDHKLNSKYKELCNEQ